MKELSRIYTNVLKYKDVESICCEICGRKPANLFYISSNKIKNSSEESIHNIIALCKQHRKKQLNTSDEYVFNYFHQIFMFNRL